MATATLPREPLSLAADEEHLQELISFRDLGNKAVQHLGYHVLQKHLRAQEEATLKTLSLKKALTELGIQPFHSAGVARYKTRAARRATRAWTNALVRLRSLVIVIAVWAVMGLVGSLLMIVAAWIFWGVPDWMIMLLDGSFVTLGGCFPFIFATWDMRMLIRSAEWFRLPIAEYPRPIPEVVLQTAVDLKEKCPEATFLIEELKVKERVLDPFLIAKDPGGTEYYLEVWNEPTFTGKREG